MKILITGANGQLGYHLQRVLAEHKLYLGDTDNYDITNRALIMGETEQFQPDVVMHAAAYTNVDGAETNQELCRKINVDGSQNVAEAAAAVGAPIVAISTDYIFAGDKGTPYWETDLPHPLSFYGQTKAEAEKIVQAVNRRYFIVRTGWLYGGPKPGPAFDFTNVPYKNFVYTMLKIGQGREEVEVVSDQIGAPTYAQDLAEGLKELIETENYGIYHRTNAGVTSWAEFANKIFELSRYKTTVKCITSREWAGKNPAATKRPKYSVLGNSPLRPWDEAIADFLSQYHAT